MTLLLVISCLNMELGSAVLLEALEVGSDLGATLAAQTKLWLSSK